MRNVLIIGGEGYIGHRFRYQLNIPFESVDIGWFSSTTPLDYNNLTKTYLDKFSHIVLLAGHSSVGMCSGNWSAAWNNNVTNLSRLISKLEKNQCLIYASSASVYGSGGLGLSETYKLTPAIIEYDSMKQAIEKLAEFARCQTIGLRFGTVCGFSLHGRSDLMINSMVKSAIENYCVKLSNRHNHRSLLGINDAVRAISIVIEQNHTCQQHEIFNLASLSSSIGNIASRVADIMKVSILEDNSQINHFDFEINTDKFQKHFNFKFKSTVDNIVEELVDNYNLIQWTDRLNNRSYDSQVLLATSIQ